jgi:hypothetical protein
MVLVTLCLSLVCFTQDTLHDVLCMLGGTACYFYIGNRQAEAIWWGSVSLCKTCWVTGLLHGVPFYTMCSVDYLQFDRRILGWCCVSELYLGRQAAAGCWSRCAYSGLSSTQHNVLVVGDFGGWNVFGSTQFQYYEEVQVFTKR